jgi:L-lysine epsilon oxidase C-terminal domain
VSAAARAGHGPGRTWDFLEPARLAQLASASPEHRALRERVARSLRRVDAGTGNMPLLNTGVDPADPESRQAATLTDLQIGWMEQWALGVFTEDWPGAAPVAQPLEALDVAAQPAALDRAALEACIGGPFYPGIEVGFAMARPETYGAPFRIATGHLAGSLTAGLAVPWQADFQACGERWWPAQRPVSVFRGDSTTPVQWVGDDVDMPGMVTAWAALGFIRREGERYVERERREPDPIV